MLQQIDCFFYESFVLNELSAIRNGIFQNPFRDCNTICTYGAFSIPQPSASIHGLPYAERKLDNIKLTLQVELKVCCNFDTNRLRHNNNLTPGSGTLNILDSDFGGRLTSNDILLHNSTPKRLSNTINRALTIVNEDYKRRRRGTLYKCSFNLCATGIETSCQRSHWRTSSVVVQRFSRVRKRRIYQRGVDYDMKLAT